MEREKSRLYYGRRRTCNEGHTIQGTSQSGRDLDSEMDFPHPATEGKGGGIINIALQKQGSKKQEAREEKKRRKEDERKRK